MAPFAFRQHLNSAPDYFPWTGVILKPLNSDNQWQCLLNANFPCKASEQYFYLFLKMALL